MQGEHGLTSYTEDLCIEVSHLYSLFPPLNASIDISIHTLSIIYIEYKAELMLLA